MIDIGMMIKNEDEYLDLCLNHMGIEDANYVIYDTGSEDSTLEILKSNGLSYKQVVFTNYKDVRNLLLSEAKNEYLIMIDGDETIIDKNIPIDYKHKVYSVNRCHYLGNGCVYYDRTARILRSFSNIVYENKLFETLNVGMDDVGHSDTMIHHFGYLKKGFVNKAKRNIGIINRQIGEQDKRTVYYSMQALYLILLGEIKEAQRVIDNGRNIGGNIWFYILQSDLYRAENNYQQALNVLKEAEEYVNRAICSKDQKFYSSRICAKKGIIYACQNEFQEAIEWFDKMDESFEYCKLINLKNIYEKTVNKEKIINFSLEKYPFEKLRIKSSSLKVNIVSDVYTGM